LLREALLRISIGQNSIIFSAYGHKRGSVP
jgi:hypothetical protein